MALVRDVKYSNNLDAINVNTIDPIDVNKFFNNYFEIPVTVSSNIDAAIIAYFEQISDTKQGAKALASAVIYTSAKQGINPMETLKEFQKMTKGELDSYTAAFLNFDRVGTSYLGVSFTPVLNRSVQRSILP